MVAETAPGAAPSTQNGENAPNAARLEDEPRPLRWTTEQFQQMGEMDWFAGRHVELIEGEILEMTVGAPHFAGVMLALRVLQDAFGPGFHVRPQGPLNINERNDPEPDIAVVAGDVTHYLDAHPTTALLVVEVSETTLRHDRTLKASLYARAGIEEYWIVNLVDDQLEVRRQPVAAPDQPLGHGYAGVQVLTRADSIAPLAAPRASVSVADLLP